METRWERRGGAPSGYDEAWARIEAAGGNPHGEADFVTSLRPGAVLDAGCGTGRVAIELARRGVAVVGVDIDDGMLGQARRKAPELEWVLGDLATVDAGGPFDVVVMAGNVMIFVAEGSESRVVANLARHLAPGGVLVAGFQLGGGYDLGAYDRDTIEAGLVLEGRWSTWDRDLWQPGHSYAVSLHRRAGGDG